MNKAQGCLSGWRKRFPLAASVPCPSRHPLGDLNNLPAPRLQRFSTGRHLCAAGGLTGARGAGTGGPEPGVSRGSIPAALWSWGAQRGHSFCAPALPRTGHGGPCYQANQPLGPPTCPMQPPGPAAGGSRAAAFVSGAPTPTGATCCSGSEILLHVFHAAFKSSSIPECGEVKLGCWPTWVRPAERATGGESCWKRWLSR